MTSAIAAPPLIPSAEQAPTVGLEIAGPALGIRMTKAYELARTGLLTEGVRVLRVGGKYRVVTAELRKALALDS